MSISKNYADRTTIFECDRCGSTFEADGLDFYEAYDEYKHNGGVARQMGTDWEHHCEICR